MSNNWQEVTKEEFYSRIYEGKLNVHPQIQPGNYPYTSVFKSPAGRVFGKSVGYYVEGTRMEEKQYYILVG